MRTGRSMAFLAAFAASMAMMGCGADATRPLSSAEVRRSLPRPPDECQFESSSVASTHAAAQGTLRLLDETRKRQVNAALQHVNMSDLECATLGQYVTAHFNTNRIRFYYFESPGAWASSLMDTRSDPESSVSVNEFRLASKSFMDTRQLTLTLLHEAYHLRYRRDNSWETMAEETAHRCYLP